MYIKSPQNGLIPRTGGEISDVEIFAREGISGPVPKAGLLASRGSGTWNGSSNVSGHGVDDDDDDDDTKPPATHVMAGPLTTNTRVATPTPAAIVPIVPSPSPVSTPSYPAPILGTPIVQGPAPNSGNGTVNVSNKSSSLLQSSKPVLPGGATAAISVIAVMGAFALVLWLYRKWSIRKRKEKLADWWLPEPFLIEKRSTRTTTAPPMEEKDTQDLRVVKSIPRIRPPSLPLPIIPVHLTGSESGAGTDLNRQSQRSLAMDSLYTADAYDGIADNGSPDPPSPVMYKTGNHAAAVAPVPLFSTPRGARVANIGVVKCVFEPRMGDELKIKVGEALRVLAEYDDGWGFCENVRGERGMIPLECLEGENVARSLSLARRSVRKSSLLPKRA